MSRSFSISVAWAVAGNASYALSQWAITIVLAKLGTPEMVGQFALAVAITTPFIVLSLLQLRGVIITQVGSRYRFGDYLWLRGVLSTTALVAALGLSWHSGIRGTQMATLAGVGAWKLADALCDIYYGRWQSEDAMSEVSKALVLNGAVSILLVMMAMIAYRSVAGAAFASAAGSAVTLGYVLVRTRKYPRAAPEHVRARVRRVVELAWLAAPLGVVMALMALQANVPRYVIEHRLGLFELGIYAAATQLTTAGGNVVTAFATVASPRLARHHASANYREYRILLARLVALGLGLGVAGAVLSALAGRVILATIYRPEYGDAGPLLVWLSLAAGIGYAASFLGYGMTLAGAMRVQAPLFAAVLAVTATGCWLLVPRLGVLGAVLSVGAGSFVQVCGSIAIVLRAQGAAAKEGRIRGEAGVS